MPCDLRRRHDQSRCLVVVTALYLALVCCMLFPKSLLLHAKLHLSLNGGIYGLGETSVKTLHSLLKMGEQMVELSSYLIFDLELLVVVVVI